MVLSEALKDSNFDHSLPAGLMITPSVQEVNTKGLSFQLLGIDVRNFNNHDVTIPYNTVLCSLQPVTVLPQTDCNDDTNAEPSFVEQFTIGDDLTTFQKQELIKLLVKWKHVFSSHDLDYDETHLVEHAIKLHDDIPFVEFHHIFIKRSANI